MAASLAVLLLGLLLAASGAAAEPPRVRAPTITGSRHDDGSSTPPRSRPEPPHADSTAPRTDSTAPRTDSSAPRSRPEPPRTDSSAPQHGTPPREAPRQPLRKIALEEHVSFSWLFAISNEPGYPPSWDATKDGLLQLEEGRLGERVTLMDKANIDMMAYGVNADTQNLRDKKAAPSQLRRMNEAMAAGVAHYPDRFKFWCALPMFDVDAAIRELDWCMARGSPGAMVVGWSTDGPNAVPNYYTGPEYDRFWASVEEHKALIYWHPRPAEMREFYQDAPEMLTAPWGFAVSTGEHMLRFILSGLFDRFPGLRFIIGHQAEIIAMWAARIDHTLFSAGWRPGEQPTQPSQGLHTRSYTVTQALQRWFYATTSGFFNDAALDHVLEVMGPDRVMFAVDYSFEDPVAASAWLDRATAHLPRSVAEKIARGNAAKLLGLDKPAPHPPHGRQYGSDNEEWGPPPTSRGRRSD